MKSLTGWSVLLCFVGTMICRGALTPYDYGVDGDGAYTANLMRHYTPTGTFATAEDFTSGNPNGYTGDWWSGNGAIDMGADPDCWYGNLTHPIPDSASTSALRWTLDQAYDLKKFVSYYSTPYRQPTNYEIRVSTTGFGSMTTVVPSTAVSGTTMTDVLATPVTARYIEYRWTGSTTYTRVDLFEFTAFAASGGSSPAITSADGLSLNSLITTFEDLTPGKWNGTSYLQLFDEKYNTSGRGAGTGDAVVKVTFPTEVKLSKITFSGDSGYGYWPSAKVEVSADNIGWTTVYSGLLSGGTADFATNGNGVHATYVRITNLGGSTANMNEIQFFGFIPEPASLTLLALGALALSRRRRVSPVTAP